jgi:hypothetical protein
MSANSRSKVVELKSPAPKPTDRGRVARASLVCIQSDGLLLVSTETGERLSCAWLESPGNLGVRLEPGDHLLVALSGEQCPSVVLGRIGLYRDPTLAAPAKQLRLEATETVTLACGEASIDLRADGKVMIRGEDVLVRAKGTKRIRAGSVSIN